MGQKCQHIKSNGEQCGRWARVDGDYCAWHDGTDHQAKVQAMGNQAQRDKWAALREPFHDKRMATIGPDIMSALDYFAAECADSAGPVKVGLGNLVIKCFAMIGEQADREIHISLVPADPTGERPKVDDAD